MFSDFLWNLVKAAAHLIQVLIAHKIVNGKTHPTANEPQPVTSAPNESGWKKPFRYLIPYRQIIVLLFFSLFIIPFIETAWHPEHPVAVVKPPEKEVPHSASHHVVFPPAAFGETEPEQSLPPEAEAETEIEAAPQQVHEQNMLADGNKMFKVINLSGYNVKYHDITLIRLEDDTIIDFDPIDESQHLITAWIPGDVRMIRVNCADNRCVEITLPS